LNGNFCKRLKTDFLTTLSQSVCYQSVASSAASAAITKIASNAIFDDLLTAGFGPLVSWHQCPLSVKICPLDICIDDAYPRPYYLMLHSKKSSLGGVWQSAFSSAFTIKTSSTLEQTSFAITG
jgi:hypothetical protein